MLESISTVSAALCLGYAFAGYTEPTSAISHEAHLVGQAASQVMRGRQSSESLFGPKAQVLSRLTLTVRDLYVDDDQDAVLPGAFRNASLLLVALPDDLPLPEIGIDPDGAISLTWLMSRSRMFSVSVNRSERMAYAWLDGSDRGHAVDRFRPPAVPPVFLSTLRLIVANDRSLVRAA